MHIALLMLGNSHLNAYFTCPNNTIDLGMKFVPAFMVGKQPSVKLGQAFITYETNIIILENK